MERIYSLLLLSILLFACTKADLQPPTEEEPREVTIRVQTPEEARIQEIAILVFQNGLYQYTVAGTSIENDPEQFTATFSARILTSASPLRFLLVANATADVINAGIQPGESELTIKERIFRPYMPLGHSGLFPMYGEHEIPNLGPGGANITGIRMVRSLARVDLDVSPIQNKFKLQSIQVFRATENIQIMPTFLPENNIVNQPSIQPGWQASVNTYQAPTTDAIRSVQQVYIPESLPVGDPSMFWQATCVVFGGIYENDAMPTYYRIDFKRADNSYPFGQVLRNHRYSYTVLSMNGPGWPTPEEAANNVESDFTITVEEWSDESLGAYYDGSHYFIISPRELRLQYRINSSGFMAVETNIDQYTIEWTEGTGAGIPGTTISNEYFDVSISPDLTRINFNTLQENNSQQERVSNILIRAGRLIIPIRVIQLPKSRNGNEIIRVMSMNEYGCLGAGRLDNVNYSGLTEQGRAMRMILNQHFRPDATVNIADIIFTSPTGSAGTGVNNPNILSSEILSQIDILFMNNNIRPNESVARMILNWLAAKKSRILMLGYDWKESGNGATRTNWEILKLLTDDITPLWYNNGTGIGAPTPNDFRGSRELFRIPFDINETTSYFFRDGPFTTPTAERPDFQPINSCYYFISDVFWGRIERKSPNIIPLINFTDPLNNNSNIPKVQAVGSGNANWNYDSYGDGNMVLGVDPVRRIVYIGDSQLFSIDGSSSYERAAKIGDNTGALSNDFSRIMANLWAWMIEEVVLASE